MGKGNPTLDDVLNQDDAKLMIEDLVEVIANHFDALECMVILWETEDGMQHRAYGTTAEVVSLLARAQYIVMRETIGETRDA